MRTIRSLERGLQVLLAFQDAPICALRDLHKLTGIPKPTLLRVLHTLEQSGLVSRRLADGRYRVSASISRIAPRRPRYGQIAEAAAPVLDRLCQKISWPSDLLVAAGDHMEIAETSQTQSPFLINVSRIGQPVNWVLSAVGRVYLAFCPERERQDILTRVRKSGKAEDRLAHDTKRFERILAETRQRGYGLRDTNFGGGAYGEPPRQDGLAAIAMPLLDGRRVHGSVNILWIKSAFTIEEFAARHRRDLENAVAEIVAALRASAK